MSAKNLKPESARSRAIFVTRDGACVVAGDEDSVTRVYPLQIVKDNPLAVFVAELERPRIVLKDTIVDRAEDAYDFPDVASAVAGHDWAMNRALKKALER